MIDTSTYSNALAQIKAIGENIAALIEQAKVARTEAVEPFLDALAASGTVSLIYIRGSTPSFNDGEPCTHDVDFQVNIKQCLENDLFECQNDGFDQDGFAWGENLHSSYSTTPETEAENAALCAANGHVYAMPDETTMKAIYDLLVAAAEESNETNYYVLYLLEDGKFVKTEGEYDPGY